MQTTQWIGSYSRRPLKKSIGLLFANLVYHKTKIGKNSFFGKASRPLGRHETEFENRTGDEPHPGRARSARRTAKTLAIFANRRRKNRKIFGKFDYGTNLPQSSNLFSRKLLKKVFGLASAPLPPWNFEEISVPKQKNFPFRFFMGRAKFRRRRKKWENFSGFGVFAENGGSECFCIFLILYF